MLPQTRAIVWAQWRTLYNFYSHGNWGLLLFTLLLSLGWYALAAVAAVAAALLCADPRQLPTLRQFGPQALLFAFIYWQIVPILLASTGVALDLKRLAVYPVTRNQLFLIEVLLRFSTGLEMALVLAGAAAGLLWNPAMPLWSPLALLPWIGLNLFLSAGLRDLLARLLAPRRTRELAMLAIVLLAAAPQLLLVTGVPDRFRTFVTSFATGWWPWQLTARLALAQDGFASFAGMLAWTAAAIGFGRWQFNRGFRFDAEAARTTPTRVSAPVAFLERLYRLPSLLFSDPLGVLIEKELRFLSRAPRFRLVFVMGFTFGLMIWLPLGMRGPESSFSQHYLTIVTFYALALLGEVCFWNAFGFDRGAIQLYFVAPVPLGRVLLAKNIAALFFVLLEIGAVAVVASFLPLAVTAAKIAETLAIALVLTIFLVSAGNLGSVLYPRPVDPAQWRAASPGRFQALLFLIYPAASIPVLLAYLARFAFDSQLAFYAVLVFGGLLGGVVYWIALDSATRLALDRRERIVALLAARDGPFSSGT